MRGMLGQVKVERFIGSKIQVKIRLERSVTKRRLSRVSKVGEEVMLV